MKRFIEGLDRSQTTLLPDCIDDYVAEDNPGARDRCLHRHARSGRARLRYRAGGDGAARLSSGDDAQDLRLRLPQPGAVVASAGAGVRTQSRADLAHRPTEARLQDNRRFPKGQRSCDSQGLPAVRRAVSRYRSAGRQHRRDRRQQVQSRQRQGEELHAREAAAAYGRDRRCDRQVHGRARSRRRGRLEDRNAVRPMRGCRE